MAVVPRRDIVTAYATVSGSPPCITSPIPMRPPPTSPRPHPPPAHHEGALRRPHAVAHRIRRPRAPEIRAEPAYHQLRRRSPEPGLVSARGPPGDLRGAPSREGGRGRH